MGIISFLLLGLVAGWIASMIMGTNGSQGPLMDMVLGVIGAFVGGFIFNLFGASGTSGLNIYSILVAAVGAMALIWVGRVLGSRV